jgi:hypothetical protein
MRPESPFSITVRTDDWLEAQCRLITMAGTELASAVGEVNQRMEQARGGSLGRRQLITETQIRHAEEARKRLHSVQLEIQDALFDCEHELRSLRERDVSPAELLIDGERLIGQYRFLKRRARVIDGLLAYLPAVCHHTASCIDWLKRLRRGEVAVNGEIAIPDCGFALVAVEALHDEDGGR